MCVTPRNSRCQAHVARALRITRVNHAVTHTLQLGRSLMRTVTVNRSLKRAPFKRIKRRTLHSMYNRFRRGRRDIHVIRYLRGSKGKLGLAERIGSNVLGRSNSLGTRALRNKLVGCTSHVTCLYRSCSSTRGVKLVSTGRLPSHIHHILKAARSSVVATVMRGLIRGSVNRSAVRVSGRKSRILLRFQSFVFSQICVSRPLVPSQGQKRNMIIVLCR